MSGTQIFTTDFLRALLGQDTVEELIGGIGSDAYKRYPLVFKQVASQHETSKPMVELVMNRSLPEANVLAQGASRTYAKMNQNWITNLYIQEYQSNYIVTWQALKALKAKAPIVAKILESVGERALALAIKKDHAFANMLNAAESSAQLYGDGQPIASTVQPTGDGSTFSNLASASADISEYSVETAVKIISQWTDTGGKSIRIRPKMILAGTDTEFDAARLLQTEYKLGTNYNDVNIVKSNKVIPGGALQHPNLNNDGSWFIVTDAKDGLQTHTFQEPTFDMRPLNQSYSTELVGLDAYVHGINDKRGIYRYPAA